MTLFEIAAVDFGGLTTVCIVIERARTASERRRRRIRRSRHVRELDLTRPVVSFRWTEEDDAVMVRWFGEAAPKAKPYDQDGAA